MTETPLLPDDIFTQLPAGQPVALAVSGGADSMAMMHLFHTFRVAHPLKGGLEDLVLTVDHGLRQSASGEAAFVAGEAQALGFKYRVIRLEGLNPEKGVQSAARAARYQAMAEEALSGGIQTLLTAHTMDDQAETVLMRLQRGSGPEGLRGILERRLLFGIQIFRPMLGLRSKALRQYLKERGVCWVEDPSNEEDRFERVRVRRNLSSLSGSDNLIEGLALSAGRQGFYYQALETFRDQFINAHVSFFPTGLIQFPQDLFMSLPDAVKVMVLQQLISKFGQGRAALGRLERALFDITRLESDAFVIGGVRIEVARGSSDLGSCYCLYRETGRHALEALPLDLAPACPHTLVWDGRLKIRLAASAGCELTLRALSSREAEIVLRALKEVITAESVEAGGLLCHTAFVEGIAGIWLSGEHGAPVGFPQLSKPLEMLFLEGLEAPEKPTGGTSPVIDTHLLRSFSVG